jgi:ABC-type phosphate transport system auxiliary subunit
MDLGHFIFWGLVATAIIAALDALHRYGDNPYEPPWKSILVVVLTLCCSVGTEMEIADHSARISVLSDQNTALYAQVVQARSDTQHVASEAEARINDVQSWANAANAQEQTELVSLQQQSDAALQRAKQQIQQALAAAARSRMLAQQSSLSGQFKMYRVRALQNVPARA